VIYSFEALKLKLTRRELGCWHCHNDCYSQETGDICSFLSAGSHFGTSALRFPSRKRECGMRGHFDSEFNLLSSES
jgi:hypothetical protein